MNVHEHHLYIFEKVQAAIDTETAAFELEQSGLDLDRIKRVVRKFLAAYMEKERNPTITSEEEYGTLLKGYMEEAYPGEPPRGEYEAVLHLDSRVKERMGWGPFAADMGEWPEDVGVGT